MKAHSSCASCTSPQIDGIGVTSGPDAEHNVMHHAMAVATVKQRAQKKAQARAAGRKEATATDLRMYRKQLAEAKNAECKFWNASDVYTLVDMRKVRGKNFVSGRWALTVKRNNDGPLSKCKARWVLRGFQDSQRFE